MITAPEDSVLLEVTATLNEWHKICHSLYLDNQTELFENVATILLELIDTRAELLTFVKSTRSSMLTVDATSASSSREQHIFEIKQDIINRIDLGNRSLNLDLTPRDDNFKQVSPIEISPIKLFRLHAKAANSTTTTNNSYAHHHHQEFFSSNNNNNNNVTSSTTLSSNLSSSSMQPIYSNVLGSNATTLSSSSAASTNNQNSNHLQMNLKSYHLTSLPSDELVEVYFSIVDLCNNNNPPAPVTEKFLVQIKGEDIICGVSNTIFTNIGLLNNRDICLYVQVYRVGKMTLVDGGGGGYKTAFGKQQQVNNFTGVTSNGSTNSVCSTVTKYGGGGGGQNTNTLPHGSTLNYFSSQTKYRRPFGSTMVLLKEYTKLVSFAETCINVKVVASNESEFSQLQDIYTRRSHSIKSNQNLPNIQLDLIIKFLCCPQESLPKSLCLTEKRGFPDIVMPGDFKNDLFFTLESAEFEKGGKSISKNIEASISLIDRTGLVIEKCISPASNCDNVSSHNSCVFYHSNSPKWNESIKINVPLSKFDSAHIRIEFRHCSTKERDKKFLGFSFLPLSDKDDTVIADKSHELYLYKCDPQLWEDESLDLCKYTSLPYGPNSNHSQATTNNNNNSTNNNNNNSNNKLTSNQSNNFTYSNRENVVVSTFLLSTKLTQNSDLLNLLRWRELIKRNNKDFEEALKKVLVLKGEEIVKFLQDILDTLFDTFTLYSASEDDYSALIFKVLVHIFLLLDEPKYAHFKPVLDTYASAHFSATLVYKGLLACVKKCLEYTSVVERHVPIQRCFKSIKHVFQFIVQSKLLYSKATGEHNDELFLSDLRQLFKLFEHLLASQDPNLIPIQVTFLESFPGTLEQLIKVVSAQELAKVIISLTGSVGFRLPSALLQAKLVFMKETANSELIRNQYIRLLITENFCKHLDCYLKHSEELELCQEVLEILIVKIHDYHWTSIYRIFELSNLQSTTQSSMSIATVGEINMLIRTNQLQHSQLDLAIMSVAKELEPFVQLLDQLFHLLDILVREFNTDKLLLVQKYCTCLLTILKLMGRTSFDHFMKRRKIDYSRLCNLFRSFRSIYNRNWAIMQLTSHSILEHLIDEIHQDLRLKNDLFPISRHLSSYIKLIVDFITHPTLQLEVFSERKKNYILNNFGDLRLKFGLQLIRFWSDLNESNICDLIPTSIQSILDASLLPNDELQQKLIPIFYDMIEAEDHFKSNSRQIERCLIDNLDLFFNLDRGNLNFIKNFECILLKMIEDRSPLWKTNGINLIKSFTKLMKLLVELKSSMELSSENKSRQMSCLVELLNFYKEQDRIDLHLKYLFRLCDMHVEVGNYVEAGLCLKLYTDEIRWCSRNLSPIEGFRPEELEWHRKEALYLRIIHYFDLGKCWEEAIALCKELASFYENYLVNYEKVSSTLKKLASFLDNILTEHRPEREYFRVEFLGLNLPDYMRDKEFVYRGGEYERLAAFIQKMISEFPEAQVLNSKTRQSITKDSVGQYMVISNVKPVPFLQEHFKSGQKNIDDKIIHYYLNNRIDTFSYDKPIMKGNAAMSTTDNGGEMNVKNLWIGRYLLKLKKQLPDILPWVEVVSQEYTEISPINHAIETISNMNVELIKLISSYKTEPSKQISPLTMRLQGVIEAAVNGGPSLFVNAFLKRQPGDNQSSASGDNQLEPPELLMRLRELITQQYSILEAGLTLHSKLAPPEVMPLHARLVERLQSSR